MKNYLAISTILFNLSLSSWGVDLRIPKSECSDIDIRDKMKPEIKKHFSTPRNQDGIGWCYAFSAADLLTAEMGEPVSASHVSAIFNKEIDNSFFMKFGYNIGRLLTDSTFDESYEGGWVDRALENAVDEKFVCSEKALPFDKNHYGETAEVIKRLEKIKESIDNDEISPRYSCVEIEVLKLKALSNIRVSEIYSILEQDNMNTALAEILEKNCKDNLIKLKKFKVKSLHKPRLSRINRDRSRSEEKRAERRLKKYYGKVGEVLSAGKPLGISYDVSDIMDSSGGHASVLTARRWKDGKCQFKIRNSWGKGCRSYDMNKIEECNYGEGSFWVDDKSFYNMVTDLDYISN